MSSVWMNKIQNVSTWFDIKSLRGNLDLWPGDIKINKLLSFFTDTHIYIFRSNILAWNISRRLVLESYRVRSVFGHLKMPELFQYIPCRTNNLKVNMISNYIMRSVRIDLFWLTSREKSLVPCQKTLSLLHYILV